MRRSIVFLLGLLMVCPEAWAQPAGRGRPGRGPGPGRADQRHDADHEVFQFLLSNHDKISRTVKNLDNGVQTLTESDDPAIAEKIKEHVQWMKVRVEAPNPIRMRDPLFAELFRHADKINMNYDETEKGVRVIETSDDPYVARLIQAHAETVSGFVERGFAEAMKNHPVPERTPNAGGSPANNAAANTEVFAQTTPQIKNHGAVYRLPTAAEQPREGTKICVDLTGGGDPDKLLPAVEKLARYVNIYAGAGGQAASLELAVVLHGDATLAVLNADAYAAKFGTEGNPNFELLHELHEQGVQIYVCGQSLLGKGADPSQVMVFVDVAVSALTAVVNHQLDGYAIVPLR